MWLIIDTASLGIGQTEPEYGLRVFPNPATTVTHVKADVPIGHILVYDQLGRVMYQDWHQSQELILNVAHWPKGMYVMYLHLEGSDKRYVQRLMVQ